MKSIAIKAPARPVTFPRLMQYPDGMVLLVTGESASENYVAGTVVSHPTNCYGLGYWSGTWDKEGLEDFTGTVTLTNEV